MERFPKCSIEDRQNIFSIRGKLFCLDTQDECLRYMRPCTCETCTKAIRIRRRIQKLIIATMEQLR